ncbi:hypothetical protein VB005_08316 [Metarhizium brunneum]
MGPRTHTIRIPDHRDDCRLGLSDTSPTPKPDPNGNNTVKISKGVDIPVDVIAIGAIAELFFMRRGKRARASTSAQELPNKGGQKRSRTPGCRPAPRN